MNVGKLVPSQVKCFHKKTHTGIESIFRTQFHTAVIRDSHRILLQKVDLDDAFKDKRFPEGAKVELIFEEWEHDEAGVCSGPMRSPCRYGADGQCACVGAAPAVMVQMASAHVWVLRRPVWWKVECLL